MKMTSFLQNRVFLMLQGPQSPFFKHLACYLHNNGAKVIKVNLCGGDVFLWGRGLPFVKTLWYQGRSCSFPAFIAKLYSKFNVTDILVYGDWRPMHQDAILLAKHRNISVWVFEEGYLRQGFATLEKNGVNGRSSLNRDIGKIIAKAQTLPEFIPAQKFDNRLFLKVKYAILHHTGNVVLFPFFMCYRTHRPHNILFELIGILPRYIVRKSRKYHSAQTLKAFNRQKSPYYFYPLQLSSDSQIQLYSPYIRQEEAITTVIASFARFAPKESRLLIKNHPLDNGLTPYRKFIASMSEALGCKERVTFVEDGNVNLLIDKAKAVVLVNSTVGLSALLKLKPVYCLGFAIYALKGLAHSFADLSLNRFWTEGSKPQSSIVESFCRVLRAEALIEGNFYSDKAIECACAESINRFVQGEAHGC
ncbi:capsular biosynthesis protein [Succinatimonas hippei]|uniref:capsule biosynthesis protein n=1 Tax=Succinatimonas hippei TaxID=626938 RepID=UPI002013758B|nr:capsular biosynthesis protein [Succinatimonas hippei]MCL1603488.1 capsular biosynthesis protein [Succinatimonas hippei]